MIASSILACSTPARHLFRRMPAFAAGAAAPASPSSWRPTKPLPVMFTVLCLRVAGKSFSASTRSQQPARKSPSSHTLDNAPRASAAQPVHGFPVRPGAGWYKGDLHSHTHHSDALGAPETLHAAA